MREFSQFNCSSPLVDKKRARGNARSDEALDRVIGVIGLEKPSNASKAAHKSHETATADSLSESPC